MTSKELYLKYKGYTAISGLLEGIICGYNDASMSTDRRAIMAVMKGYYGWPIDEQNCNIRRITSNHDNPLGYWLVDETEIRTKYQSTITIPSTTLDFAEQYIQDNYPDITDDEKDIYLNIFLEGYKNKPS
jgi:hypothetical protein